MSAAEVLVIFLSVALAIFLALAILLTVYLIVIVKKINRIADTAERSVQGFAEMLAGLQRAVAPAVVTKFVADLVSRFTNDRKKEKD